MKINLNGCEISKQTLYVVTEFTNVTGMTAADNKYFKKAEKMFVTDDNSGVYIYLNKLQFAYLYIKKNDIIIFSGFLGWIHYDNFMNCVYKIRRFILVNEFNNLKTGLHKNLFDVLKRKNENQIIWADYLQTYKFDKLNAENRFIKIEGKKNRLFLHLIINPKTINYNGKWILFAHGFLDHSGSNAKLTEFLLNQGYSLVYYDLPGHGISDGERWGIEKFTDYYNSLCDVISWMNKNIAGEFNFIGHSTGTSGFTEGILNPETSAKFTKLIKYFKRIIFIAPLIRFYMWELSKFSVKNLGGLFKMVFDEKLPRISDKATKNKAYNEENQSDLLSGKYASFSWAKALVEWNEKNVHYGASDLDLVVFQGQKDEVVDFNYNIPYLKQRFRKVKVIPINGARHSIQNESGHPAEKFYSELSRILK